LLLCQGGNGGGDFLIALELLFTCSEVCGGPIELLLHFSLRCGSHGGGGSFVCAGGLLGGCGCLLQGGSGSGVGLSGGCDCVFRSGPFLLECFPLGLSKFRESFVDGACCLFQCLGRLLLRGGVSSRFLLQCRGSHFTGGSSVPRSLGGFACRMLTGTRSGSGFSCVFGGSGGRFGSGLLGSGVGRASRGRCRFVGSRFGSSASFRQRLLSRRASFGGGLGPTTNQLFGSLLGGGSCFVECGGNIFRARLLRGFRRQIGGLLGYLLLLTRGPSGCFCFPASEIVRGSGCLLLLLLCGRNFGGQILGLGSSGLSLGGELVCLCLRDLIAGLLELFQRLR
jgi:hypothetical protein